MSEPQLTESQKTCLRLVGAGMSSKEIAIKTGLSPQTIDQYLRRAAVALGASNRREAARILVEREIVPFRKSELKSPAVVSDENSGDLNLHTETEEPVRWRMPPALRLPPIGGDRHDLDKTETAHAILRVSLFTVVTAGIIIATFAWLNSIFT